jgi:hypothetical protein
MEANATSRQVKRVDPRRRVWWRAALGTSVGLLLLLAACAAPVQEPLRLHCIPHLFARQRQGQNRRRRCGSAFSVSAGMPHNPSGGGSIGPPIAPFPWPMMSMNA